MFILSVTLLWRVNYAKLLNLEKLPGISCRKIAVTWIVRCYSVWRRFFSIAQMCCIYTLWACQILSVFNYNKENWIRYTCLITFSVPSIAEYNFNLSHWLEYTGECIVHGEWQLYGSCCEYIRVNMISSLNRWDKLKVCFECGLFSEQWAGHGRWTCSKTDVMLLTGACLGGCSEYSLVTWIWNTMPRWMMRSSVAADPPQRSTFATWHY